MSSEFEERVLQSPNEATHNPLEETDSRWIDSLSSTEHDPITETLTLIINKINELIDTTDNEITKQMRDPDYQKKRYLVIGIHE